MALANQGMTYRRAYTMPRPQLPAARTRLPAIRGRQQSFLDQLGSGVHNNANGLIGLGMGLLSEADLSDAIAAAGGGFMQGNALDADKRARIEAAEQSQDRMTRTVEAMLEAGRPDLANMAEAGFMGEAWQGYLDHMKGGGDALKPTSDMQEYEFARSQGYDRSFQDYQLEMKKAGATNIGFNATQGRSAAYADRMAAADAVLNDPALEKAQTDLVQQQVSGVPVAGNYMVSKEFQQAEQAQRDFVNAVLRRESGAVISPSEFENARKQYFPQPGDSKEVIEQKRRNRKMAIDGVARESGPNYAAPDMTSGDGWSIIGVE